MPTDQQRLDGEREIERMTSPAQRARAIHADTLWLLHSDINKLVAAAAYEIIEGADPAQRKRRLHDEIRAACVEYLA